MSHQIPCWTDCDLERTPSDGSPPSEPLDRSMKYRAAVEDRRNGVDAASLCRVWNNWRDSSNLVWILHGFLMITTLRYTDDAWKEIDFLQDMLRFENE